MVMMMAPDAAREPYSTAAAGPLSTEMLSTSSWLMSMARFEFDTPFCRALPPPPLSMGMPSTTNRGWLLPVKVVRPRMKMFDDAPTMPLAA